MGALFGGAPQAAPPPPMPQLQQAPPMPIPDKEEERRAALKAAQLSRAGKTTMADTIIGAGESSDDRLG